MRVSGERTWDADVYVATGRLSTERVAMVSGRGLGACASDSGLAV
jgi:hypothetical protein